MVLRLADEDREAFLGLKGATPFEPMPGRAMMEYVVVPQQVLGKPSELRKWLRKSFEYANSLPKKTAKKKKSAS